MSAGDPSVGGARAGPSRWLFRRASLPLLTAVAAALALGLNLAAWLNGPRASRTHDDGAAIGAREEPAEASAQRGPAAAASVTARHTLAPPNPLRRAPPPGASPEARWPAGKSAASSPSAAVRGSVPEVDLPGAAALEPAAGPDEPVAPSGVAASTEAPEGSLAARPAMPSSVATDGAGIPAGGAAVAAPITCPTSVEGLEDVAADLVARRARFDEREMALLLRAAALEEAERRLAQRAAELEQFAAELQTRSGELDAAQAARIARLVKVYEAMKPKQAAEVFDRLPLDLAVGVAAEMREAKIAAVLAAMSPDRAQRLTTELARLRRPAVEPGTTGSR